MSVSYLRRGRWLCLETDSAGEGRQGLGGGEGGRSVGLSARWPSQGEVSGLTRPDLGRKGEVAGEARRQSLRPPSQPAEENCTVT